MTTVATGQVLLAGTPPAGLAASFAALHVVSQRARVLRLRRTEQPLSITVAAVLPSSLSERSRHPDPSAFRSSIAWLTRTSGLRFTRHLAMSRARLEARMDSLCPFLVGVGIVIAHDPLHGSGRADLPHLALTSGNDAHAAVDKDDIRAGGRHRSIKRRILSQRTWPFWLRRESAWCQGKPIRSRNAPRAEPFMGTP
jgi:hypothetical protein